MRSLLINMTFVFALLLQGKNAPAQVTGQGLYIYDGQYLIVIHSDPDRVHVDQWGAFYFQKGASTSSMSQRWGMETKNTPAEVMKSVEASQKFERTYEKWCRCDWGTDTFFNVIAPIAMTKSALDLSPKQHQMSDQVHGIWDRGQEMLKLFNDASATADADGLLKSMSGPFAVFMRNMHTALDQAMSINTLVTQYSDSDLASLETQLNEFNKVATNVAETAVPAVRLLDNISTPERRKSTTDQSVAPATGTLARNNKPAVQPGKSGSAVATSEVSTAPKDRGNTMTSSTSHLVHTPNDKVRPAQGYEHLQVQLMYAVQVAAFDSEAKADAMISQLKRKKYNGAFIEKLSGGRAVYRVRVGQFTDLQAARDLQKNLERDGFNTFVATLKQ